MSSTNVWRTAPLTTVVTEREVLTASEGQTVFNLTTMTYTVGGNLQVYVNGVKQIIGISYAYEETSSSSITFTSGLTADDVVEFVNFV